jgi:hypothetical protein
MLLLKAQPHQLRLWERRVGGGAHVQAGGWGRQGGQQQQQSE